jgi:hypothetical protein
MTRDEIFDKFTREAQASKAYARQAFEWGCQQGTREMREWIPIATRLPEMGHVVLTQHIEDIYPVPAFFLSDADGSHHWMLEREGPEDTHDRRPGKNEPLYREPTHWQELPEGPPRP